MKIHMVLQGKGGVGKSFVAGSVQTRESDSGGASHTVRPDGTVIVQTETADPLSGG